MRDLTGELKDVVKDENVIFYDGFLYIINENGKEFNKVSLVRKCLCAEYNEPISLADIARDYPNCHKLLYEDCLHGELYNHNNHQGENEEEWELVGRTVGYV